MSSVVAGSGAERGGLEQGDFQGDFVVSADGDAVDVEDLLSALRGRMPGEEVALEVLRGTRERRFASPSGRAPNSRSASCL